MYAQKKHQPLDVSSLYITTRKNSHRLVVSSGGGMLDRGSPPFPSSASDLLLRVQSVQHDPEVLVHLGRGGVNARVHQVLQTTRKAAAATSEITTTKPNTTTTTRAPTAPPAPVRTLLPATYSSIDTDTGTTARLEAEHLHLLQVRPLRSPPHSEINLLKQTRVCAWVNRTRETR